MGWCLGCGKAVEEDMGEFCSNCVESSLVPPVEENEEAEETSSHVEAAEPLVEEAELLVEAAEPLVEEVEETSSLGEEVESLSDEVLTESEHIEDTRELLIENTAQRDIKEIFFNAVKDFDEEQINKMISNGDVKITDPRIMYESLKVGGGRAYKFFSESITPELIDLMLVEAAKDNNPKAVMVFISEGGNINAGDIYGNTALHEACKDGQLEMTAFLIEKGADVNGRNKKDWTPLHRAANYGHLDIARYLIKKDANLNNRESEGMIPLVFALQRGYLDVAALMIEKGADVNCIDKNGNIALLFSLKRGYVGIAEKLLLHGADPGARDESDTALIYSMKNEYLDIAKFLIEKGADPNMADKSGETPLLYALKSEYFDIAALLLERGANVNCKDIEGRTPLHFAAKWKETGLVKTLLEKGANSAAQDIYGYMPIHEGDSKEINALLKKKMLPAKIMISLRVFALTAIFGSIVMPYMFAVLFGIFNFMVAAVFTAWPTKTSYRLYILEIFTGTLVVMNVVGLRLEGGNAPWHFLVFPLVLFLIINFGTRPVLKYFVGEDNVGGKSFGGFFKKYLADGISFSPLTLLRGQNVLIMIILMLFAVSLDFEYLSKNDEYLLGSIMKMMPQKVRAVYVEETTAYIPPPVEIDYTVTASGNRHMDQAIAHYLKKNFRESLNSLSQAERDPALAERARELRMDIARFRRLWDFANLPAEKRDPRRRSPIEHMIRYDKNISDGKLEAEIRRLELMMKAEEAK
jgi:ankyrin repeat protein